MCQVVTFKALMLLPESPNEQPLFPWTSINALY